MIDHVISANHKEGKGDEAWAWSAKLASYIDVTYPETNVRLMRNLGGPQNQGHWVQTHESLAAMEAYWEKLDKDAKWQELLAEDPGLWFDFSDSYFQTVK